MLNLVLLLAGFVPLILGANWLVESASTIARKLKVADIVIGLTIVAFGTSAPELVVNTFASVAGNSDIVLGNIVGSNIFNVLAILGISSLIYPLVVKSGTTWSEIPLSLLSALAVLVMANDRLLDGNSNSVLTRVDGILLLFFFLIFIAYTIKLARGGMLEEEIPAKKYSMPCALLLLLAGLVLLVVGGRVIVHFAVLLARDAGIPERIIAITIVSIGTSLPELATSIVAALKKNVDIAIGNVVGSNIFNIFFILGISAVINPVSIHAQSNLDLLVNIGASLLLFAFIFTGKGRKIERWEGGIFIAAYVAYCVVLISGA
ncbi:MAG: calcium/sodium antiporter [Spirochaetes bacterium]|nr:calcium/sodium antiporter [Spirochaetota bacterium]